MVTRESAKLLCKGSIPFRASIKQCIEKIMNLKEIFSFRKNRWVEATFVSDEGDALRVVVANSPDDLAEGLREAGEYCLSIGSSGNVRYKGFEGRRVRGSSVQVAKPIELGVNIRDGDDPDGFTRAFAFLGEKV